MSAKRLFRVSDIGYVAAALVGGVLVGSLPGGVWHISICPTRESGTFTDVASVVVATLSFVATSVIAVIAHRLNATLKTTGDHRSRRSARAFTRAVLSELQESLAAIELAGSKLAKFYAGEEQFGALLRHSDRYPIREVPDFYFTTHVFSDLPDDVADAVARYLSRRSLVRNMVQRLSISGIGDQESFEGLNDGLRGALDVLKAALEDAEKLGERANSAIKGFLEGA